jgi:type IV pilus assembly protein PilM
MSAQKKTFALDLGMQTVALAEFETLPGGGLALLNFRDFELMVDPAADITRNEQIKVAIEDLRTQIHLGKNSTGHYCLPSQAVFTRFVRLPGQSPEDIKAVIGFEAQQNVPFPIDEVVWDYQILGAEREGNWDVVLVAIKSDQLGDLYDATAAGGLRAESIDLAPMALYNAYRYNYSDYPGTTLLIDMGARTTNLIFIDGDKVFSRTIPIGGNTISVNVGKEMALDVTAAETLKKEKGYVALGGAYADADDPTVGKISKLSRTSMTRLHAEIARSISFYRANQGGSQPVRALLAGGGMSMGYMLEFFAEKLQMPVEFFNPLRNVTVANGQLAEQLEGKVHTLGELVGSGLRALGGSPVEINLRPAKVKREQEVSRRQPALVAAIICVAAGLLALFLYFQSVTEKLEQVTQGVQSDVNRLQGLAGQITQARQEKESLEALAAPFLLAAEERVLWVNIVDALADNLPRRFLWVTQMTPISGGNPLVPGAAPTTGRATTRAGGGPTRPGASTEEASPSGPVIDAIRVDGLYLENPAMLAVVDEFVDNLAKSDLFVVDNEVRSAMVRTQPDGSTWAYSFSFTLPLKRPIALP